MTRRPRKRGFTLIELLLVIALLALLASMVWPDFVVSSDYERLDESARRMRSLISMCRAEAMFQSRVMRIGFRTDGSLRIDAQIDPIYAPDFFTPVNEPWARQEVLLEGVWVNALHLLPDGPAPLNIDNNDQLEVIEELVKEPLPIESFASTQWIRFSPDGSAESAKWILRDKFGRAIRLIFDGRMGRVTSETLDPQTLDEAIQPVPLDETARLEPDELDAAEAAQLLDESRQRESGRQ